MVKILKTLVDFTMFKADLLKFYRALCGWCDRSFTKYGPGGALWKWQHLWHKPNLTAAYKCLGILKRQNIIFRKNMSYVIFQTWLLKCYSASLKRKWNISLAQHNGLLIVWHSCCIISKTSNWDLCGGILMDTTGFGQYSTKY